MEEPFPNVTLHGFMSDWRITCERLETPVRMADTGEMVSWLVRIHTIVTPSRRLETDPDKICIVHTFAVPTTPTIEFAWDCCRKVAVHEIDEGFWVGGMPIHDPHLRPDAHNRRPSWMGYSRAQWSRE